MTDRYRVYALTRRGHGGSERTADGYAVPALASDVLAFMDQRGIERAALIGHSMAGDEITAFAARWPQRVTRLVYLDAALDHSDMEQAYAGDPVEAPPPTPEDFATRDSLLAWYKRQFAFWSPAQQANFEAGAVRIGDGTWRIGLPSAVATALNPGLDGYTLEYERVRIPALAIYAVPMRHPDLPVSASPALAQAAQAYVDRTWRPFVEREIDRFEAAVGCSRVVRIPDGDHYLFIAQRDAVLVEVREFLEEEAPCG